MPQMLNISITAPPGTVKVDVHFYNSNHRQLLLNSPAGAPLTNLALPTTLDIPTVELLTYYLFYKKRPGTPGYTSYLDIKQKIWQALVEFEGQVCFHNNSLRVIGNGTLSSGTTERLGEAIGLSVISHMHQLIDADWARIPVTNTAPTLDYEYAASNGSLLYEVELKGSINDDNRFKTPSVSNHKTSIETKKSSKRNSPAPSATQPAMLYGTISVLDNRNNSVARCWLLDPPLTLEASPREFRIMARLSAISDLISFLSARSQLAAVLKSRIDALRAVSNIDELDGVVLRRANGEEFSVETYTWRGHHNPWFVSKSRVLDGPAGGNIFQVNGREALFIGIREELVILAIEQSFGEISAYEFPSGTVWKHIDCLVPAGRFRSSFSLPDHIETTSSGGYVRFRLEGYLHYTSSGMIFGVLPLQEPETIG